MPHKCHRSLIAVLIGLGLACPLAAAQQECTVTTVGPDDLTGPCTDVNPVGTDLPGTPLIGPNESFARPLGTPLGPGDTIIEDSAGFWDAVLGAELAGAGVNPLAGQFGAGAAVIGWENIGTGEFGVLLFEPAVAPLPLDFGQFGAFHDGLTRRLTPYEQRLLGRRAARRAGQPWMQGVPLEVVVLSRRLKSPPPIHDLRMLLSDEDEALYDEAVDFFNHFTKQKRNLETLEIELQKRDATFQAAAQGLADAEEREKRAQATVFSLSADIRDLIEKTLPDLQWRQLGQAQTDQTQAKRTIATGKVIGGDDGARMVNQAQAKLDEATARLAAVKAKIDSAKAQLKQLYAEREKAEQLHTTTKQRLAEAQSRYALTRHEREEVREASVTALVQTSGAVRRYVEELLPAAERIAAWGAARKVHYDRLGRMADETAALSAHEAQLAQANRDKAASLGADIGTTLSADVRETLQLQAQAEALDNLHEVLATLTDAATGIDAKKSWTENVVKGTLEKSAEEITVEYAPDSKDALKGLKVLTAVVKIGGKILTEQATILANAQQQGQMITYLEQVLDPDVSSASYNNEVEDFVQNNADTLEAWTGQRPATDGSADLRDYIAEHAPAIAEGLSRAHLVTGQPVEIDNRLNNVLIEHYQSEAVKHTRKMDVYDQTVARIKTQQAGMLQ